MKYVRSVLFGEIMHHVVVIPADWEKLYKEVKVLIEL